MAALLGRARVLLVVLGLAVLTLGAFGGTLGNGFVYDDTRYVLENRALRDGLTFTSFRWAFTSLSNANWHPVTWLSHALDVSLFDLSPAGHHATSLGFHGLAVVLLFFVLHRFTGLVWPSAFAAALFAVHPLRVESVAWVAERKDVLSAAFFMLTLLCWLRYLRRPAISRYAAALASFALGLMAKSMLVTLPLLLLLLDYWPLGRCCRGGRRVGLALLREKTPFLVLAAVSSGLTLLAQRGAMAPLSGTYAITARLSNALVSCVAYLGKFLYPAGLAVFYPHRGPSIPLWKPALAAVLLAGVTALVLFARRRAPHLVVGWAWYLGMLVPVIGIVQVGSQAMADRYTYLPLAGIFMAIAWTLDLAGRAPRLRPAVMTAGLAVVLALVPITARQVTYWHDEKSLFGHALTVIPENPVAHDGLGSALTGEGRYDEALRHHREAIRISPSATPYFNLGVHYTRRRMWPEAVNAFRTSVSMQPEFVQAHANLGAALASIGSLDEAIEEMQVAVRLKPDEPLTHFNLGLFLEARGRLAEAQEHFGEALRLDPRDAEARARLREIRRGGGAAK